ncbi:hypothetical protein DV517_03590 [Streptomyces sp. S816]|uniref:eCIS core domain-containing protein n=1 Tax=Streptomyces sp. S816 TaxID=2283197 RepID=UPI00109D6A60|nr:DUF4157 domain-containing protein [Streptomyces sp. S816]TGZ15386.1 hypothetical protein DV517_03590 [Streptomyces sp. S816]
MHARDTAEAAERTGTRKPPAPAAATRQAPGTLAPLQRSVGNAAVVQMLRRNQDAGGHGAEEEAAVQRSAVHGVLRAPGRPLAEPVRQEMEARFGTDFSDVRVHDDAAAQSSAAGLGARAYTSGSHVVIGPGGADRHTLAHELTHVVQQRQGPVAGTPTGDGLRVSDPADRFERAAEANAHRVLAGPVPAARREEEAAGRSVAGAEGSVQRFTDQDVGNMGELRVSVNGAFAIADGANHIWVRADSLGAIAPALQADNQQAQFLGATYHRYSLGGDVLNQCLHVAEEIINDRVNQLPHGQYASTIDTHSNKNGDRTEFFGQPKDGTNRRMAREFTGARDEAANPQVGQAFVIVALRPGEREMSQFHAAAVVARDGDDCVTLEAFAGTEEQLEPAAARMYTVNGGGDSFHGYWTGEEMYYHGVSATTVIINPNPDL